MATEKEKQEWIQRYVAGETARNIAKDYPYHESTISRYIKDMGYSRGRGKTYKVESNKLNIKEDFLNGMYCCDIAKKYGIAEHTVYKILDEYGLERTTGIHNTSIENYFSNIDTPNKAYILGFIAADGSIGGKYDNKLSIEVHEKDADVLNFILSEINPSLTITDCISNGKTNKAISIHSKQIFKDLNDLGIIRNKSENMPNIPVDKIPKELLCYYFRGLIDGDGSISPTGGISIYSGTESFIKNVQDILVQEIGVTRLGIYKGTAYFVSWNSKEDKIKIYNYLYGDHLNNTFYYKRKHDRIFNYLYGNTEVNDSITQGESSPQSVEGE